jgi:hypothetical protein
MLMDYGVDPDQLDRMDPSMVQSVLARRWAQDKESEDRRRKQKRQGTTPPGRPGGTTEIAQIGQWNAPKSGGP